VHSRGEKQFRSRRDEVWTSYMRGLMLSVGCACWGHRRGSRTSTVDCRFCWTQRSNCSIYCSLFRFGVSCTRCNTISYVGVRGFWACILQNSRSGRWHSVRGVSRSGTLLLLEHPIQSQHKHLEGVPICCCQTPREHINYAVGFPKNRRTMNVVNATESMTSNSTCREPWH